MFFSIKKKKNIDELFIRQFNILRSLKEEFMRFFTDYLNFGESPDEKKYKIDEIEKNGDAVRREIEADIERGSVLPYLREDYIILAEMIDSICDRIQSAFIELTLTKPIFPLSLHQELLELNQFSLEAAELLEDIFLHISDSFAKIKDKFDQVENKEHDVDILERDLISKIFSLDIEYAQKLHLKGVIELIASFSDLAEDTSDRMQIIAVKRTI